MKIKNGTAYLGDCIEIMKSIPDGSIDAIITDPPYGSTACKWDSVIPFEPMWAELKRIIKPNGAIVLFGSEPFSSALRMSNIKQYKYDWIWEKNSTSGFALAKKQPMRNHENISIFYSKQPTYNYIKEKRKMNSASEKRMNYDFTSTKGINVQQNGIKKVQYIPEDKEMSYPKTVKFFENIANNSKDRVHPTQKPVALLEYLIKTYTSEGETVLDFTAGSFTTSVACDNTNRKWICIERDLGYCKIGANRINENRIKLGLDILDFERICQ